MLQEKSWTSSREEALEQIESPVRSNLLQCTNGTIGLRDYLYISFVLIFTH